MQYINDLSWEVCSFSGSAKDNFGLEIVPAKIGGSLAGYDAVIIPGGHGTRQLQLDNEFLSWIKTAAPVKYKMFICTGSLILGLPDF